MPVNSLQDLFLTKLQMIYDAEQQGLEAMPLLAQRVSNPEVRQAFETHHAQTEQQVQRLEQLFQLEGQRPQRAECISMRALIQEAQQQTQQIQDPDTLDAFLIGAEQAVEHHEIAAYGTARSWAQQLGRTEAAELLEQTLQEEEMTDQLLSDIAERLVNEEAAQGDAMLAGRDRDVTPRVTRGDVGTGAPGRASARGERPKGSTEASM